MVILGSGVVCWLQPHRWQVGTILYYEDFGTSVPAYWEAVWKLHPFGFLLRVLSQPIGMWSLCTAEDLEISLLFEFEAPFRAPC